MSIDLDTEWRDMQRRLLAQLQGTQAPDQADQVLEVSADIYTDPIRFEREREQLFQRLPLLAGLSAEVANPGDHICFDAAGVPVLVIRGDDGELRAFLNICTHRGARLVGSDSSCKLVCPYHGWSFRNDGSVKAIPQSDAFTGLDLSTKNLVRLPVAQWQGLVFVIASPGDETIDVEAYLGDMAPLLAALQLGQLQKNAQDELSIQANWKLALDTGREIYHVPVVHRNTLAKNIYPNAMIFDCYGLHNRYSGAGRDFEKLLGKAEAEWPDIRYQAVHYIYPNTTLSVNHSVDGKTPLVSLSRVFPGQTVDDTTTLLSTYSRDLNQQSTDIHQAVVNIVDAEDYQQARQVWKNLAGKPEGFKLVFGRNEALLQQYHIDVANHIDMPLH